MNHIEFYENIIKDIDSNTFELRHELKKFYSMELKQAIEIIDTIKTMLDMKLNDFMRY